MLDILNTIWNGFLLCCGTYLVARTAFYLLALRIYSAMPPPQEGRKFALGCVMIVAATFIP